MTKKMILLVDDSKLFLELEKNYLKLSPVRILTASSGEEALEIAKNERPDLVFMDINMPGMGGLACCKVMKSVSSLRSIPIIMVSTAGPEKDIDLCRKAGCDDYLTKPIDRRLFLEKARARMSSIERREIRIPCRVSIFCKVNDFPFFAKSTDLSINGMYIVCDQDVEENMELTAAFTLQYPEKVAIAMKGRIAWVNNSKTRKRLYLPVGFGVEFIEIPDYAGAAIRAFIESRRLAT